MSNRLQGQEELLDLLSLHNYNYDYKDEVEMQKTLQCQNMRIVVTLVLFLGLVIAIVIAVGVALVIQDCPGESPDANENLNVMGAGASDDEYGRLVGGVDSGDILRLSAPSSSPSNGGRASRLRWASSLTSTRTRRGVCWQEGSYHREDLEKNEIVWKSKYYRNTKYFKKVNTFRKCFL